MLDKLEKTLDLIAAMKAAIPFEVELTPSLLARLHAEDVASEIAPRQLVRGVSYAGDEGGIVCHLEPNGTEKPVIVSLNSCANPPQAPLFRCGARLPEASGQEVEEATAVAVSPLLRPRPA